MFSVEKRRKLGDFVQGKLRGGKYDQVRLPGVRLETTVHGLDFARIYSKALYRLNAPKRFRLSPGFGSYADQVEHADRAIARHRRAQVFQIVGRRAQPASDQRRDLPVVVDAPADYDIPEAPQSDLWAGRSCTSTRTVARRCSGQVKPVTWNACGDSRGLLAAGPASKFDRAPATELA